MKKCILPILIVMCFLTLTACGSTDSKSGSAQSDYSSVVSQADESAAADASDITESSGENSEVTASAEKSEPSQSVSSESSDSETENNSEQAEQPDQSAQTEQAEQTENSEKDTIVVYFSATGTTRGVAERIASVTNADIYEIVPAQPYTEADLDWNDRNSRTTLEMDDPDVRPAIENDTVDLSGYSTVYIGYPIWWGDAPRIMSTFVESHGFDGKTVIPFCTSGGSGIGRSGDNLASQAQSGTWLGGDRLDGGISEDELREWINGL